MATKTAKYTPKVVELECFECGAPIVSKDGESMFWTVDELEVVQSLGPVYEHCDNGHLNRLPKVRK